MEILESIVRGFLIGLFLFYGSVAIIVACVGYKPKNKVITKLEYVVTGVLILAFWLMAVL